MDNYFFNLYYISFIKMNNLLNYLKKIFEKQHKLIKKYQKIEQQNGIYIAKFPEEFHTHLGQERLRNLTFRFVEELFEVYQEFANNNISNIYEELSDALHFLTELSIETKIKPEQIANLIELNNSKINRSIYELFEKFYLRILSDVYDSIKFLKIKPWRQSIEKTDFSDYQQSILSIWISFFDLLNLCGIKTAKQIYLLYNNKNLINQKRIKNNY